jgi:chromosome segregation ATPase
MADIDTSIEALRERLTQLLADWGTEMSMVLKDLGDTRAGLAGLEERSAATESELESLRCRMSGQEELIESLRGDAEEAAALRKALSAAELEAENLRSELDSKLDLVKALRKDAEKIDGLRTELKRNESELASLGDLRRDLEQRLAAAEDSAADSHDDITELAAVRAELAAKTSLLQTLRADAERCETLEERLDEKRTTISELETSLESQAATISDLKQSVKRWKDKYTAAKSGDVTNDPSIRTVADLPTARMAADELDPDAANRTDELAERTLAINMRDALRQARDTVDRSNKGKVAEA